MRLERTKTQENGVLYDSFAEDEKGEVKNMNFTHN